MRIREQLHRSSGRQRVPEWGAAWPGGVVAEQGRGTSRRRGRVFAKFWRFF
jgi:hypothetical protein